MPGTMPGHGSEYLHGGKDVSDSAIMAGAAVMNHLSNCLTLQYGFEDLILVHKVVFVIYACSVSLECRLLSVIVLLPVFVISVLSCLLGQHLQVFLPLLVNVVLIAAQFSYNNS